MSSYITGHGYDERPIHDCHFHFSRQYPVEQSVKNFEKIRAFFNLDRILLLSYLDGSGGRDMSANAVALYLKERLGPHTYAFAGFSHWGDLWESADGCRQQAILYRELGFDGIKFLEGKPNRWHTVGRHLDSAPYESFYAYAEETAFPILMHAGDYKSAETDTLLHEVENVLKRHPGLRLTLAHFANCVNEPERLCRLLDTYENLSVDLALGGDFVLRFSENQSYWRPFFIKYQDRILYGTDTYNQTFTEEDAEEDVAIRHTVLRSFFEDTAVFYPRQYQNQKSWYGSDVIAIHPMRDLPQEVVDKIYRQNFVRLFGEKPRDVDRESALLYTEKILDGYKNGVYTTHAATELPSYMSDEERANMARGTELAIENLETITAYYKENFCKQKINVLLIGDSIRMNYQERVGIELGDGYSVWGSEDNGRFAKFTLADLRRQLTLWGKKPDIIHWNNGLWDTAFSDEGSVFTTPEEYRRDMAAILRELKKITPHIIFATTTPVKAENHNHNNETIAVYNRIALSVIEGQGVAVNDLNALVGSHMSEYICEDTVHLSEVGKKQCAAQVAACIRQISANMKNYKEGIVMKGFADCHVHIRGNHIDEIQTMLDDIQSMGVTDACLAALTYRSIAENLSALYWKIHYKKMRLAAFGGLHLTDHYADIPYEKQAETLLDLGCDGIKLIDMHTDLINYSKKFTSHPDYDKMLSLLEERGVPLLLHANNPVECWAKSNEGMHPGLALYQGSALGAFADYETIYRETLTMLDKHPKLNIVIAHFFFLSSNMDRAKFVLEKYPNLRLDITPGTDMFFHFMKCPEKWHDFFTEYSDRILFGTDCNTYKDFNKEIIELVYKFISEKGGFTMPCYGGHDIVGLGLDEDVLEKICYTNYLNFIGNETKPVNVEGVYDAAEKMLRDITETPNPYYEAAKPLLEGKWQEWSPEQKSAREFLERMLAD